MNLDLTAIVLAAGEGKRMQTLGADLPKVMLPILGKPVLSYVLDNIVDAAVGNIVIVISRRQPDSLTSYFGKSYKGIKIEYVYQDEQLGPAQAIALALPRVKSDYFLVQYGDSLSAENIAKKVVAQKDLNPGADGVLAVRQVDDPKRYGIVKYEDAKIVGIVEKPKGNPPGNHAVMGTFILNTNLYKKAIEDEKFEYGKELFPAQYILQKGGKMESVIFEGKRVDFGEPQDLFGASQLLSKKAVRCLVFDADNTLYNSHEAAKVADKKAMKTLADKINQKTSVIYKTWQELVAKIKNSKNPQQRTRIYSYTKLCAKYGQDQKAAKKMYQIFTKELLANLRAADNLPEILKKLPQEKFIATDDVEHLATKKLEHLKLKHFFKQVVSADFVGTMKPSEKFYETIVRKYQPAEILVIGDDWKKDLEIPARLGMQVIFVENPNSFKQLLQLGVQPLKIHIMGIAGAGAAAVAGIAKGYGYKVNGCDINPNSPYAKNLDVNIKKGHDSSHLTGIDMLVTSPAIEITDPNNRELKAAKARNIPKLSWQEFQGKYLQKDKFVICVAGAYGKSTTAAMISQILIDAGFDPTCEIGAIVRGWHSNFKVGKSKHYVCEADEYNNNFLNYYPDVAIVLNVGWDHPDFFKTQQQVIESYKKFINKIKSNGTLIIGSDPKLKPLVNSLKKGSDSKVVRIKDFGKYNLKIIGSFRKTNADAAVTVASILNIDIKQAKKSVKNFEGTGRRLEYKGEIKGVKFYDDYAVQPYTILKTSDALKAKYKNKKVLLVLEPHTFSRINTFFAEFVKSLGGSKVDEILVTEVFSAREKGDKIGLSKKLVKSVGRKAKFTGSLRQTASYVRKNLVDYDIVLTMGAGDIYKLYDLLRNRQV